MDIDSSNETLDNSSNETLDNSSSTPRKLTNFKPWILGFLTLGLFVLIVLTCGVYFAFDYIRNSVQSTSLGFPSIDDEHILNQIAFVGNDRNIWLVSADGKNLRSVTTDGRGYSFPTWSPNNRRLAFTGTDEKNSPVLYISPTDNVSPTIVYQEQASAPFYLYWAPNSTAITFLTQELSGLALQLVDVKNPAVNRVMEKGAPFYWVWSPDSDQLLMHVGGARTFSENAHLSFLDNQIEVERVELDQAPGQFQAPVWSVDGQHIYYIAADENNLESIYRMDAETLDQTVVTNLDTITFMVLSPTDRHLAYLQFETGTRIPFGKAYLVNTDGTNHKSLAEFLIASIYWSPDGQKLALLGFTRTNEGPTAKIKGLASPLKQEAQLRWWIYDIDAETLEPLTSFSPTAPFLQTVPFFDQYHLSLTFWSPDSRYFVVTKRENEDGDGAVWVYDTLGEESARKAGEGTLAVWSWK